MRSIQRIRAEDDGSGDDADGSCRWSSAEGDRSSEGGAEEDLFSAEDDFDDGDAHGLWAALYVLKGGWIDLSKAYESLYTYQLKCEPQNGLQGLQQRNALNPMWRPGDVVGCLLEVSEARQATLSFSLNGRLLGPAFEGIPVEAQGLCSGRCLLGISLGVGQRSHLMIPMRF